MKEIHLSHSEMAAALQRAAKGLRHLERHGESLLMEMDEQSRAHLSRLLVLDAVSNVVNDAMTYCIGIDKRLQPLLKAKWPIHWLQRARVSQQETARCGPSLAIQSKVISEMAEGGSVWPMHGQVMEVLMTHELELLRVSVKDDKCAWMETIKVFSMENGSVSRYNLLPPTVEGGSWAAERSVDGIHVHTVRGGTLRFLAGNVQADANLGDDILLTITAPRDIFDEPSAGFKLP